MKKFISCLLTFVLILSLMAPLSVCVSAEDTTVFGTDDYNIDDEDDLLTFGQLLETNTFEGKTIVLTNDITLTQEWNAVYASNVAFYGIFDGQGHTITGLEKPNASGNWGFIPNGGGCTIQNVTFKEVSITSSGCTGTIVGYKAGSGDMTFINVHVQGSLSGSNVLGGFVGATRTYNTVSFTNCSFVGSLTNTSSNYTGGLVGGSGAHITATNCYVNATIEANSYVGGIIGQTGGSGVDTNRAVTVTNCYIDGSITTSAGGQRVGGIGGRLGKAVVTDCVVAMDITASDTTTLVAAFAAQSLMTGTDSTATFTRCVYTGNLTAKGEKVGLIKIRLYRPFPAEEIAEALKNVKAVAIMDRAEGYSNHGGPLGADVMSAMFRARLQAHAVNYIYGLGGRDVRVEDMEGVFEDLKQIIADGDAGETYRYMGIRE